ncbi:MAG TPA: SOS response-associated peptidase [Stackebrandtia sp.]|jgi:putative SOS response-associated peptidase YedK|uniref:SOS response-associated peptidase n=1 Tax=Stackebrandtia sp. TaxID=2023065 RepID=UPI002D6F27BC|nr:SOS response-associated peptidase [Stackebrandtia sp.]HZE38109.1 SOS response-associated peptidase [Stackebrandtia sp.]
MCGRYVSTLSVADLALLFEALDDSGDAVHPSYNLAPTRMVPVVRRSRTHSSRVVSAARWGLVPSWAKDPSVGTRMFNARSETVATKSAYRSPFARKRCLVPADGWYEWRKLPDGGKQPYFMTAGPGRPLVFAGLWDFWDKEEPILSCTILTTEAIGDLERVHDRMPLLLGPERYAAWLGEEEPDGDLLEPPGTALLSELEIRPVGRAVGNVRNDAPQLIEAEPEAGGTSAGTDARPTLF